MKFVDIGGRFMSCQAFHVAKVIDTTKLMYVQDLFVVVLITIHELVRTIHERLGQHGRLELPPHV